MKLKSPDQNDLYHIITNQRSRRTGSLSQINTNHDRSGKYNLKHIMRAQSAEMSGVQAACSNGLMSVYISTSLGTSI